MSGRAEVPLSIARDHPAFAGHFPGAPVVPGVVLIDEAMVVIAAATGHQCNGIAWVKFLLPVGPGQAMTIRYEPDSRGGTRFEITAGTDQVATGSLVGGGAP